VRTRVEAQVGMELDALQATYAERAGRTRSSTGPNEPLDTTREILGARRRSRCRSSRC